MIVTSPSFTNNGSIPVKHTGFGKDKSPEFQISAAPENTASFAIILDDLDVPWTKNFNHWIIWNIPKTQIIPEGLPAGGKITSPITATQGKAWGKNRYRGPKQPFFIKKEHRYVFYFYALDTFLDISENSNKKALQNAMQGHILAETQICGRFKRHFYDRRNSPGDKIR